MDIWSATEEAYKRGYSKGYEDGERDFAIYIEKIVLDKYTMEAKIDFMRNGKKYSVFIPWDWDSWK